MNELSTNCRKKTDPTVSAVRGVSRCAFHRGVTTMMDPIQLDVHEDEGFTLLEVLISMALTLIVMGAVFGLLTRGQRSFQREPQVADLQQNARAALDLVAKDILQAGAGLPPEFPAFSRLNGAGDNAPTDVIEIFGQFQSAGTVYLEPEEIETIGPNPDQITLVSDSTNLEPVYPFNMVIVYNDVPNGVAPGPQWKLGTVTGKVQVPGTPAVVTIDYGTFDSAYNLPPDPSVPAPADYPRDENANIIPKVARFSVVRYFTQPDDPALYAGPPPQVLMRLADFGINGQPAQAVGYLEDFQIAYVLGVTAPVEQNLPPDPAADLAGAPLNAENTLSSVRVTLTARSVNAGMEGASQGASAGREDDFIRKTFSTNVNPRNLSAGVDIRVMTAANP